MRATLLSMSQVKRRYPIGAELIGENQTHFRIWAPKAREVDVVVEDAAEAKPKVFPLNPETGGYFAGAGNASSGSRYRFRVDRAENAYPDPASRFQPDGPHGASCIVDPTKFRWSDADWPGLKLKGQVFYEMHIGTFTTEGTWCAAVEQLIELARIGISVIEMMPVAEFPGRFGWGYDGVDLFAPSHLYGTPDGLRTFVDRAHSLGIGVILDIVYNHFGPDGNYLVVISAVKYGFLYQGQALSWRQFLRGTATLGVPPESFVCFIENHDQIANTGAGERPRFQTSLGRYRAMTALLLLGPWTPLLFQGEEFGASNPFMFFADIGDASVRDAIRNGRAEWLAPFLSLTKKEALTTLPAPDDPKVFARCKLDFSEREKNHQVYNLHLDLLKLRREDSRFGRQIPGGLDGAVLGPASFALRYFSKENDDRLVLVNFGERQVLHPVSEPLL